MFSKPLTDVTSPVTTTELQSWLELPTADTKLGGILMAATEAVINHLQRDLINRAWKATVTDFSDFKLGYGPGFKGYAFLELPFSGLVSVSSVELDDEALAADEYEIDTDTTPGRIHFYGAGWSHKIEINYTAGMGAAAGDIPEAIKTAIKMVAAHIFEHRGACSAESALKDSGATALIKRYRVERL